MDHIRRISDGGAPFDLANLRTLCVLHDNQSHREKGTGAATRDERFVITGSDMNGMSLDPNDPWFGGAQA